MKLKIDFKFWLWVYFLLMLIIYHSWVDEYHYWTYLEGVVGLQFDHVWSRTLIALVLFRIDVRWLLKIEQSSLYFAVATIFLLMLTTPSLIAFTSGAVYRVDLLAFHQLFFLVLCGLRRVKIDFSRIPVLNRKQSVFLLLCLLFIGAIPYLFRYGPYLNWKNLFLIDVYETRAATGHIKGAYFGYSYSLFTKIVIPLILIFSLELKNTLLTLVAVIFLLLFYLFGAHKMVYASLAVIFIFYQFSYTLIANRFLWVSVILVFSCILLALIGINYPWILTVRRVHFLPSLLDVAYLDYFKDNFIFWSDSFLRRLVDYPFDLPAKNLIGDHYFKKSDMAANNGFISDGYMNAGFIGVLFNCMLIWGYFVVLNSLRIPSKYFGLFFLVVFSFISSATLTVFLTHGALFLLIISIFLLNEKESSNLSSHHSS